jgi:hypothetical protein
MSLLETSVRRSSESALASQVEYLTVKIQIVRKRIEKRFLLNDDKKRLLVRLGRAVRGEKGVLALLTFCSSPTYGR